MAKIRMMNMMFYGFQGVYEYEKEQGAKLSVAVEMVTRDDKACDTDQIEDGAIDGAAVYPLIQDTVEETKVNLLMTLAAKTGDRILQKFPHIVEVTTRVRKHAVLIHGPLDCIEVEVTRRA